MSAKKAAAARASAGASAEGSSNGNGFVAQLSRRVKACDACRKHKIRCDLPANGEPPCSRCVRNHIECKLTKSLQSILDERQSDKDWKASVEARMDAIVKALEASISASAMNELHRVIREERERTRSWADDSLVGGEQTERTAKRRRAESVKSDSPTEGNLGLLADAASVGEGPTSTAPRSSSLKQQWADEELADPASAPGEHLRQLAEPSVAGMSSPHQPERVQQADIIDRGIITLRQACTLTDLYLERLDEQVYWVVTRQFCTNGEGQRPPTLRESVSSIRKSPLLLLAICTVASLHCGQTIFNDGIIGAESPGAVRLHSTLYHEFVRVSAQRSFARHQSMDDVRALLIGSWWLRDLSWILTASAVRLATERGMQESYKKCSDMQSGRRWAAQDDEQPYTPGCAANRASRRYSEEEKNAYEEARLYFLVYIADHQAALPFGRPPMTRQHAAVRNARAWLAGCPLAVAEDARLIAHVELWVIAHDVVDDFGVDVLESLTKTQVLEQVPRFAVLIDRWQRRWRHSFFGHQEAADIDVEADMMRLFIDAHAFRAPPGISPLLVRNDQDAYAAGLGDGMDTGYSFAYRALPSFAPEVVDERQSRFTMGARAVESAHRVLNYYRQSSNRAFGRPIYYHVMLIFACLFLNKLSKTYGEDRESLLAESGVEVLTLPNCNRALILGGIEAILQILKDFVGKCVAGLCASAIPGLSSIISEAKRHPHHPPSRSNSSHLAQSSLPTMSPTPMSFTTAPSPSFGFDLQTLDLLSDTRFLSGISNDASLWYGQHWLPTATTTASATRPAAISAAQEANSSRLPS